jgi:ABC-type multidrug transport system ATPase subunit
VSAIAVEDLVKRYGGFTAVEDVSFTAAAGEVTALLGPNGAGKTTTIEILEGFQAPTAGTVRVLGTDLTGLEVGPPSLEDAYIALTSEKGAANHG